MTPLRFTTTSEAAILHGVKMCVHSRAGAGKTTLIGTLPTPLVLSAESGLLSLRHLSIPTIIISSLKDMEEASKVRNMELVQRHSRDIEELRH